MVKWTYLAGALAWAVAAIYEWMWYGGSAVNIVCGVAGLAVFAGLFIWRLLHNDNRKDPQPMIWFLLAALTVTLFYSMLEKTANEMLTHIPMLPVYIILFLDFFLTGCYTWWKKLKKKG